MPSGSPSPLRSPALVLSAVLPLAPLALGQEPGTSAEVATTRTATDGRWRLENRLENPLIYLSRLGPALVDPLPLLDDPVLQKLLGPRTPGGFGAQGSGALLRPLARLLSNRSEDLELALTKMVPGINAPTETASLIFRCQLPKASAEQVAKVLHDQDLAVPARTLHGRQVYQLKASSSRQPLPQDPQNAVEVALVEDNLVVSNDPQALDQAISPETAASAPVLSQNTRYKDLRKRIDVPEGAVMLYAHWARLGPRRPQLSTLVEKELGLPFFWSGLGDTDRLLLVVRPAKKGVDGFVTSVLLGRRPKRHLPHWQPPHWPEPEHDGWLQAVEAAKPQQLLAGLQPGALGCLAVAVDPNKLLGPAARSPRMLQLQAWIFGHAFQAGVDVRGQIIRRLGKVGSAQVLLLSGDGVKPRVAYSFQARTGKQARELIADLKKALATSGRARSRQLESGREVLEIASPGFGGHSYRGRFGGRDYALLAAVGDAVYFTFDQSTMEQIIAEAPQASRVKGRQARTQHDTTVRQFLKHLGVWDRKVAGVFAADLSTLAHRVSEKPDTDPTRPGLFGMHAGYITLEQELVRLEVFSPR